MFQRYRPPRSRGPSRQTRWCRCKSSRIMGSWHHAVLEESVRPDAGATLGPAARRITITSWRCHTCWPLGRILPRRSQHPRRAGLPGRRGMGTRGDNPRICNTLITGDHVIATDACRAHLMGSRPASRLADGTLSSIAIANALLVCPHDACGWGRLTCDEIDFQSEAQAPLGVVLCQGHLTPRADG